MVTWITGHAEIVGPELVMLGLFGLLACFPRTRHLAHRLIRTGKALACHPEIPRWARVGFVLATLPIPGPFDEIVGAALALALLKSGHARTVRAEWAKTAPAA